LGHEEWANTAVRPRIWEEGAIESSSEVKKEIRKEKIINTKKDMPVPFDLQLMSSFNVFRIAVLPAWQSTTWLVWCLSG
jgi:hypothetical protein